MTSAEINKLIKKYAETEGVESSFEWLNRSTQYDDRSAKINYSMVRKYRPNVVVEFGTRTGRCTHDILRALLKNGGKFVYKPYELENPLRIEAQTEINRIFGKDAVQIGEDIMKANDLPQNIEYLFIDNYHDELTTKWVLSDLLKRCRPGCLVQIHDWTLTGDWKYADWRHFDEMHVMKKTHDENKLPLTKLYWAIDEGNLNCQSAWFIYNP